MKSSATPIVTAYLRRKDRSYKGDPGVTSDGPRGPAYIPFPNEAETITEPWENHGVIVVDYDAARAIAGIELVSLGPDDINDLVEIARLKI